MSYMIRVLRLNRSATLSSRMSRNFLYMNNLSAATSAYTTTGLWEVGVEALLPAGIMKWQNGSHEEHERRRRTRANAHKGETFSFSPFQPTFAWHRPLQRARRCRAGKRNAAAGACDLQQLCSMHGKERSDRLEKTNIQASSNWNLVSPFGEKAARHRRCAAVEADPAPSTAAYRQHRGAATSQSWRKALKTGEQKRKS